MSAHRSARDEAAGWFARIRSGKPLDEDASAFEAWIQPPANARAYERMTSLWHSLEAARAEPAVLALREQALGEPPARMRVWSWAGGIGAAAAAVAVFFLTPLGDRSRPGILPETGVEREFAREVATAVGQRAMTRFEDGTTITLDTDTLLRVVEWESDRVVELVRGQARFDVESDPERPFSVLADGRRVTSLGTVFDVRVDPETVSVTLVEGRVRVEAPDESASEPRTAELTPGSRLTASRGGHWRVARTDTRRATSWLTGELILDGQSLAQAVAEMNRYSEVKLTLADDRVAATPVSGVFQLGRSEEFARALQDYGLARIGGTSTRKIELVRP